MSAEELIITFATLRAGYRREPEGGQREAGPRQNWSHARHLLSHPALDAEGGDRQACGYAILATVLIAIAALLRPYSYNLWKILLPPFSNSVEVLRPICIDPKVRRHTQRVDSGQVTC